MSEIEELIENDFLNLDEFIFKFKWKIDNKEKLNWLFWAFITNRK